LGTGDTSTGASKRLDRRRLERWGELSLVLSGGQGDKGERGLSDTSGRRDQHSAVSARREVQAAAEKEDSPKTKGRCPKFVTRLVAWSESHFRGLFKLAEIPGTCSAPGGDPKRNVSGNSASPQILP